MINFSTNTLQLRYFSKLTANVIVMAINFIIAMMIPRALGPEAFGNFEFLSSFFTRVVNFLNMGSSTAFYTKLSQRPNEFGLVSFYLSLCGIMILLLFIIVSVCFVFNIYGYLWPDQTLLYISLGALWGSLSFLIQVFNKMADAFALTVKVEIIRVIQKVLGLGIITSLFVFGRLNLITLFLYHYFLFFIFGTAVIWLFSKKGYSLFKSWYLSSGKIKNYLQEFFDYCHPLFTYALAALIMGILDRWLLQYFSGSIEQGYFGLGFKIGTICFLFTSAMTPLIHREYAIAFEKNNLKEIANIFRRYIPLFYSISAYLSCFVLINAHAVTYIIGGSKFESAALVVAILCLHPIHQTYGQLSDTLLMATGQTKLVRNIGVISRIFGIPATFFILAPAELFGLGLGAVGLAIKYIVHQLLVANVVLFFNARMLKLNFLHYLGHQIACVIYLIVLAYIAKYSMDGIIMHSNIIINLLLSGIVYTLLVMFTLWKFPIIFGLRSSDINRFLDLIRQKLS